MLGFPASTGSSIRSLAVARAINQVAEYLEAGFAVSHTQRHACIVEFAQGDVRVKGLEFFDFVGGEGVVAKPYESEDRRADLCQQ